jgi:hypothetical protein
MVNVSISCSVNGQPRREYISFRNMMARCENPAIPEYHNYGGRGISVHPIMRTFSGFWSVLGACPAGLTLDRYPNNNGNYEPGNVRWATLREQSLNKRNSRIYTHNGITKGLIEWAESSGIAYWTLIARIDHHGWSFERAISAPTNMTKGKRRMTPHQVLAIRAGSGTPSQIAAEYGIDRHYAWSIKNGRVWPNLTQEMADLSQVR